MEDLQARFVEAGLQYAQLANERQAILTEMDKRNRRAKMDVIIAAVPDDQLDTVVTALTARAAVVRSAIAEAAAQSKAVQP